MAIDFQAAWVGHSWIPDSEPLMQTFNDFTYAALDSHTYPNGVAMRVKPSGSLLVVQLLKPRRCVPMP